MVIKAINISYQLILDDGAEEAVIMPSPESAEVLRDLIKDAETHLLGQDERGPHIWHDKVAREATRACL